MLMVFIQVLLAMLCSVLLLSMDVGYMFYSLSLFLIKHLRTHYLIWHYNKQYNELLYEVTIIIVLSTKVKTETWS